MEPTSLSKENIESLFAKVEDWYKAVLFDSNGKPIATKNASKLDENELV